MTLQVLWTVGGRGLVGGRQAGRQAGTHNSRRTWPGQENENVNVAVFYVREKRTKRRDDHSRSWVMQVSALGLTPSR
ncbi:hypothetical protein Mapa_000343 [Marchantia paleacea]|nr:hypothetical protein Mapa_000343 [Marchantia paleacea]